MLLLSALKCLFPQHAQRNEIVGQIALKRQALEKRQAQDRKKLQESLTDFRLREERERAKATQK